MKKNVMRFMIGCALVLMAAPSYALAAESKESVLKKLELYAKDHVSYAAEHVVPSKKDKAVRHHGGNKYVASYVEIDSQNIQTELRTNNNSYVGIIKYQELLYECQGTSKEAALSAPCSKVRTRRMTEILGYDKKWRP